MLNVQIKTVKKQRYPTVGDYYSKGGRDTIKVSNLGNRRYEFLVALHEMVEMFLCEDRGIRQQAIDDFDMAFEKRRKMGLESGEPGNDILAPYHREHQIATRIETIVALELGIDWKEYDEACQ